MTDDQLWQQQQDAQRFARERAQQLETEGIERLEQERIERDQLEEEERLYREERAQNRRETENGRSAEESERGTGRPLSLLSGIFGLMRRQHKAYRPVVPELQESHRSHSDDEGSPNNDTPTAPVSSIVPPMHIIPGDETAVAAIAPPFQETSLTTGSSSMRSRHLVVLVGTALAGAAVWFYVSSMSPARLPTGLEGTPEEFRDSNSLSEPTTVAPLADPAAEVASEQSPHLDLDRASSAMLGAPESLGALSQEPNAAKTLANTTPDPDLVRPGTDAQTLPLEPVGGAVGKVAVPDPYVPPPHDRIAQLEKEVEQLKVMLSERPQASAIALSPVLAATAAGAKAHKARGPSRAARQVQTPVPVETVTPEPQYNGRLLSVDMWDGKLSVVVSTGDPNDKRVRVLQPGESYNGITLREASVQNRNASFDVGGGKLVKLGVEE